MPRKPSPGLPTRKQILDFIEQSGQPAGKREIARAFNLSSHDKIMLKALLKDAFGDAGPTGKDTVTFTLTGGAQLTARATAKGKGIRMVLGATVLR